MAKEPTVKQRQKQFLCGWFNKAIVFRNFFFRSRHAKMY